MHIAQPVQYLAQKTFHLVDAKLNLRICDDFAQIERTIFEYHIHLNGTCHHTMIEPFYYLHYILTFYHLQQIVPFARQKVHLSFLQWTGMLGNKTI